MAAAATPAVVLGGVGAGAGPASPTKPSSWGSLNASSLASMGSIDLGAPVRQAWNGATTALGWIWFTVVVLFALAFTLVGLGIAAALIYYGVVGARAACSVPLSTAAITLGALIAAEYVFGYALASVLPEGPREVFKSTGGCAGLAGVGVLIWATVIAFEGDKWLRYRRGDNGACDAVSAHARGRRSWPVRVAVRLRVRACRMCARSRCTAPSPCSSSRTGHWQPSC